MISLGTFKVIPANELLKPAFDMKMDTVDPFLEETSVKPNLVEIHCLLFLFKEKTHRSFCSFLTSEHICVLC